MNLAPNSRTIALFVLVACALAPAAWPATVMVADINPSGSSGSDSTYIVEFDGSVFFRADDGVNGIELWKSDGITTQMVADIDPAGDGVFSDPVVFNGALFFKANEGANGYELWKSDGTEGGTVLSAGISINFANRLCISGGTLFFTAYDAVHGYELWKSDGTTAQMVVDISPGGGSSNPNFLTDVNGTIFFVADDGGGEELWKSDGTTAQELTDLSSSGGSIYGVLRNANGTLYFSASNGSDGQELWKSNGTPAGTRMVVDFWPDGGSSWPRVKTFINGRTLLTAQRKFLGNELCWTDGTTVNVLADINPFFGSGGSYPNTQIDVPFEDAVLNNYWFFNADDAYNGRELWKTDGFTAQLVADIAPGSLHSRPLMMAVVDQTVFFSADDGVNERQLWKTDGTTVQMVATINPSGDAFDRFGDNVVYTSGRFFFFADDGTHGVELWMTDGVPPQTVVWCDFSYNGMPDGTFDSPFRTLANSLLNVTTGGTVKIKPGTSNKTLTINQAVTLQAVGGTVQIGDSGAKRDSIPGATTGFVSRPERSFNLF